MKQVVAGCALSILLTFPSARPAFAQASDPFLGEIQTFAFSFCPAGWLPLNGQLLQISQYAALFDLIGTSFGGDGVTTFALPKWGPIHTANGGSLHSCIALQGVFPSQN